MKIYFAILTILISVKSFANCSALNGIWNCGGANIQINIQERNGDLFYIVNELVQLHLNGRELRLDLPGGTAIRYTATCNETTLQMNITKLDVNGNPGDQIKEIFSLTSPTTLNAEIDQTSDKGYQPGSASCILSQK